MHSRFFAWLWHQPYILLSLTALFWAVREDFEITKLLLENDANPNIKNNNGFSPLMFALSSKDPEIVKILLSCGADIEAK